MSIVFREGGCSSFTHLAGVLVAIIVVVPPSLAHGQEYVSLQTEDNDTTFILTPERLVPKADQPLPLELQVYRTTNGSVVTNTTPALSFAHEALPPIESLMTLDETGTWRANVTLPDSGNWTIRIELIDPVARATFTLVAYPDQPYRIDSPDARYNLFYIQTLTRITFEFVDDATSLPIDAPLDALVTIEHWDDNATRMIESRDVSLLSAEARGLVELETRFDTGGLHRLRVHSASLGITADTLPPHEIRVWSTADPEQGNNTPGAPLVFVLVAALTAGLATRRGRTWGVAVKSVDPRRPFVKGVSIGSSRPPRVRGRQNSL